MRSFKTGLPSREWDRGVMKDKRNVDQEFFSGSEYGPYLSTFLGCCSAEPQCC
jgi:hypothetical protein